jgi:hypothetical protein
MSKKGEIIKPANIVTYVIISLFFCMILITCNHKPTQTDIDISALTEPTKNVDSLISLADSLSKGSSNEVIRAGYILSTNNYLIKEHVKYCNVKNVVVSELQKIVINVPSADFKKNSKIYYELYTLTNESKYNELFMKYSDKEQNAKEVKAKQDSISAATSEKEERVSKIVSSSGAKSKKVRSIISKHPDWSDDIIGAVSKGSVRLGMTEDQAIAGWGRPNDINRTTGAWGVHEQWVYGEYGGNYLYFEDGLLTSIQN